MVFGSWGRHLLSPSKRRTAEFHRVPGRVATRVARIVVCVGVLVAGVSVAMPAAQAAAQTTLSLTFDNGPISQYTLGYQQALQPHGVPATFYVNSGTVGSTAKFMSWTQLSTLAAAGNDIGGKTVHGINLKTTTDTQTKIDEVCKDRQALLQHGLAAATFAYPFGAFDATAESIVKGCGYGNGRTAGSVSPAGPTWAETFPPKDWLATRAYAPSGQVTLANLQALVNGAAAHNGGWDQVVIQKVCSQTLDAANYTTCTASAGYIELADLNAFLDWVGNAGQPGGAPAGTVLKTVRDAAIAADAVAPTTTISCDGAPCSTANYPNVVHATLTAADLGSSLSSTHYTTDGSDPTLASPTYTGTLAITSPTTLKFRSWDYAGNVEAVRSQLIQANPPPDTTAPTTTIACNGGACDPAGYTGSVTVTLSASDGGGWGVDKTYYTTDGSTPTQSSPVYSGPFQLSQAATVTVKFFSTDIAGNVEAVNTQQIKVLPPPTTVSLTFDDGLLTQYQLGFKRALAPRGLVGTFYNVSGLNGVDPQHMTWSQLTAVNNGGNEIGGHTVDHVNIKTLTDYNQKVREVCQDRQNLLDHGFYPVSFAYPEGAYDATAEQVVQGCGYSTARAAGQIDVNGDGAGPVYAETLPPKDIYATRTVYDPPSGSPPNVPPLTLSHLQASVTGASTHGGGWVTFAFHEICSQTYDPDNYSFCINDWGPIELTTLNEFLDWLKNAGQPGGAPANTTVKTVSQTLLGPDTSPPNTAILCDNASCQSTAYNGSVTVSLNATDPGGSGIKTTYYTTDGSTPTTSSPVYTGPFTTATPETVRAFSVDNAGNTGPAQAQAIQVQPNPNPIVAAAGDIACDPASPAFNDGEGTDTDCRAKATAQLMNGVDAVLPLGDNQYDCGGPAAFAQSYGPTWGVKKGITRPVPGDKDYATSGGTDCPSTPGAGYYNYFGSAAGDPAKGYYSYDLGSWHVIALNTALCGDSPDFCAAGSAQEQWLQADLAANASKQCTLAYYQNPRFVSSDSGGDATYQPFWDDLYGAGVDVVMNGDSHWYERLQQMNSQGKADTTYGVREFIVGTGGAGLDTPGGRLATSQVLNNVTHGVLRLTLRNGAFDWSFVPVSGETFTDSGTGTCHAAPPQPGN